MWREGGVAGAGQKIIYMAVKYFLFPRLAPFFL